MTKGGDRKAEKAAFLEKFRGLLRDHKSILVLNMDNVGSKHLQGVRRKLRGEAVIQVCKNTTTRCLLRQLADEFPEHTSLIPFIQGNICLVFTNGDLKTIRTKLCEDRVRAPAKKDSVSPVELVIPAGSTGLDTAKTSFFQVLGIPTKIVKGMVEITNSFVLLKIGQRVGASDAALLNMLGISPFTYGLNCTHIYSEGSTFTPDLLDISESDLISKISEGIQKVAALSLALGVPTTASAPHIMANAYKNVLAVAISTGVTFPLAKAVLDRINNPDAYIVAVAQDAPVAAAAAAAPAVSSAKQPEPEEEEEEEDFDIFG